MKLVLRVEVCSSVSVLERHVPVFTLDAKAKKTTERPIIWYTHQKDTCCTSHLRGLSEITDPEEGKRLSGKKFRKQM